jgi:hypothetical protein
MVLDGNIFMSTFKTHFEPFCFTGIHKRLTENTLEPQPYYIANKRKKKRKSKMRDAQTKAIKCMQRKSFNAASRLGMNGRCVWVKRI